jgi:[protein-PII] uridylyltransferase
MAPRVELVPDEKAQNWLLHISTGDKVGLLYTIARVLNQHSLNVLLAKVATLGERVEDTFLIQGASLQNSRMQIDLETELKAALTSN